jgi:thiamine-phosphate pyrophosphorylase
MSKPTKPSVFKSPDGKIPRLYAIIDPLQTNGRSSLAVAAELLAAGVRLIQLRDKHASSGELYSSAEQIAQIVRTAGGIFIINDRADVTRAMDGDGVHVGQDDLPVDSARNLLGQDKIIGYSTHVMDQVREADLTSADYIAFGPIFPTGSKENPDAVVGLEGLREARKLTRKPLVAIGGITLENASSVIEAGADSVAVIRALVGAPDIRQRAEELLQQVSGVRKRKSRRVKGEKSGGKSKI